RSPACRRAESSPSDLMPQLIGDAKISDGRRLPLQVQPAESQVQAREQIDTWVQRTPQRNRAVIVVQIYTVEAVASRPVQAHRHDAPADLDSETLMRQPRSKWNGADHCAATLPRSTVGCAWVAAVSPTGGFTSGVLCWLMI